MLTAQTEDRTMPGRFAFTLFVALLGTACSADAPKPDPVQGGPKKSDAVVKVSAAADKPDADGKQVVTVTLAIDSGWHTYGNPVGLEDLADAQTTVSFTGKSKPEVV